MDTRIVKGKNNESGTFTQTLSTSEVGTAHVSPVPREAPGVIFAKLGQSEEEAIFYKTKDDGAGTISGLTRDYTNLNGGNGREHVATSPWETAQAIEYVNNLVDAAQQGYHQEMNTIAYVGATQFTVATDQTSFYTAGRILRFNQDNTKIGIVSASSYSSGTGLTTVTINYGTVPSTLTHVEMSVQPKGATNLIALVSNIQNGSYIYAADAGSTDDYAITLSPAPTAYMTGMVARFKANTASTGAATLNVNSLGAKTIKKKTASGLADLADNDIQAGDLVEVQYDGTNFQLLSAASIPVKASGAEITTGTDDAKFVTPKALADAGIGAGGGVGTDGWSDDTAHTWVYVSATSFKITGIDLSATFRKGTRVRFKQGGAYKYGTVVGVAFSTDTTVTLAANNDYSVANAAITDNYYSYQISPQGYPTYFSYTPTLTKPTGMTGTPSIQFAVFQIIGGWCHVKEMWSGTFAGTVSGTSWTMSLPVSAVSIAGSPRYTGVGYAERVGAAITIIYAYSDLANMNLRMYNNAAFANGDQEYDAEMWYPI